MRHTNDLQFVLHVSDFHLSDKEDEYNMAERALNALTSKLQKENIKIDYLVHTGDVINSGDLHEMAAVQANICGKYSGTSKKFDFSVFNQTGTREDKQKFNDFVKDYTKKRFAKAAVLMTGLTNDLNLPMGNVVICCGNHDAMRLAVCSDGLPVCEKGKKNSREYTYSCCEETRKKLLVDDTQENRTKAEEEKSDARQETEQVFSPFNDFLARLGTANSKRKNEHWDKAYPLTYCSLGKINFLILNTNWRNPQTVKPAYSCVHCDHISDALKELGTKTTDDGSTINIVVAHKPIYEICETARLAYKRYVRTSVMSEIHDFLGENGIFLCGDKHTRSMIGASFHDIPHYIGGEPFTIKNEESGNYEVEYNLLGIADGKLGLERKIHLRSADGVNWNCDIRPQDAIVSRMYDLCKGHISPRAYAMIDFLKCRNTWEALSQRLYETNGCNIDKNENLNVYFKTICKYRENGVGDHIWENDDNVFRYVHGRIQEGMEDKSCKNILNLRGGYSSGKSTYLGLLYIYLLYQYSIGAIKYIPVYFALENKEMLRKVENSGSYYDAVKFYFTDFACKVQEISSKEQQPVCYIIDRLDEQDCWSLSSEDSVGRCLLDVLAKYQNAWYIMSFGQHRLPFFKNTMPVRKYSDRSDVLYFNPIEVRDTSLGDTDERFKLFVQTYLNLEKFTDNYIVDGQVQQAAAEKGVDDVLEIIRKFRRLTITPGFMRQNYAYISELDGVGQGLKHKNATVKEVYGYYIDRQYERCLHRLGYGFVEYAPAMAFLFSYKGYTYEQFKHLRDNIDLRNKPALKSICDSHDKIYNAFMFIKKHRDSREYLIALHYHRELRYYAENPGEEIEEESILNEFITRNIAVEIRKMWTDSNKFKIVCEKLIQREKISNCTLSMLAYCLANLSIYEPIRYALQTKLYKKGNTAVAEKEWKIPPKDSNSRLEYFMDLSLLHTMEIYALTDDNNSVAVVKKMIDEPAFAQYNRQHQMLYYRDLSIRGEDKQRCLDPGYDIIYKGFDFHHCFNYLSVKLNGTKSYLLQEFDLFTLCDLVESRLNPRIIRVYPEGKSEKKDTFFYREKSNDKALQILEKLKSILEVYLSDVKNRLCMDDKDADPVLSAYEAYEKYKKDGTPCDDIIIVVGYFQSELIKITAEFNAGKLKKSEKNTLTDEKTPQPIG